MRHNHVLLTAFSVISHIDLFEAYVVNNLNMEEFWNPLECTERQLVKE